MSKGCSASDRIAHMTENEARNKIWRGAFHIVLAYAVFAGLWILLSDRAMGLLFSDPAALVQASMAKGWFFVAVTSLLLYALVRRLVGKIAAAHRRELELARELQRVPAMLETIAENTDDAIFVKDLEGRYLLFNKAASRIVGEAAEDVLGRDDRALFPPEQAAMLMAIGRRVIETGKTETNEEELHTAEGTKIFLATKGPLRDVEGRIFGLFGISRDITERKQAEDAVHDSERRLHDIVNASADWVWEVDVTGRYTYASESVEQLLGYTPAEVIGKTPFDFMPPAEAARVRAEFAAVVADKMPFRDLDNINLHKDGSLRHVWTNGTPILAADGTLLGYRGLDRDITERKVAETRLRSMSEDMKATLQAIPDLLFELDSEGRYLVVRATHEALLAAQPEQLLGRTVSEILPPDAARTVMDALANASLTGTDYGRSITLPLAQGISHFEISVARKPAVEGQAERFVVLSRDITTRKAAEADLQGRNAELLRTNQAMIGRELTMIEMKKTINALHAELGRAPPYPLDFLKNHDASRPADDTA
jgi:PAS domain S-box-containing protein